MRRYRALMIITREIRLLDHHMEYCQREAAHAQYRRIRDLMNIFKEIFQHDFRPYILEEEEIILQTYEECYLKGDE